MSHEICFIAKVPWWSYSETAKQMLDDFHPRALKWCSTDVIPDNVVNMDICKSYPIVLLSSTHPIPLYSMC